MDYTVKAASRATGVDPARIRTWERRYGVPAPKRSESGRRLYSEDDLQVIRRMASLTEVGIAAHEAAAAALEGEDAPQPREAAVGTIDHPLTVEIAAASQRFDESAVIGAVTGSVEQLGWARALEDVIFPSLRSIGRKWATSELCTANEHFATELIRAQIAATMLNMPMPAAASPTIVLACPVDENHQLGVQGLALLLREKRINVVFLGGSVPTEDLLLAYRATGASAVCLAATTSQGMASLARASRILVATHNVRLFVGGPGLRSSETTAYGIQLPESLAEAVEMIAKTLNQAS